MEENFFRDLKAHYQRAIGLAYLRKEKTHRKWLRQKADEHCFLNLEEKNSISTNVSTDGKVVL